MREDIRDCLARFNVSAFGFKGKIEEAVSEIPNTERIHYIAPSNVKITPRNTNKPTSRTGILVITDKHIRVFHKAGWEEGRDVFLTSDIELVGYSSSGIAASAFELTLKNVSLSFIGNYHKDYAEDLYEELSRIKNAAQTKAEKSPRETSAADEIRKFKALLDDGIISEDEFNTKKKQLLGL